MKCKNLHEQQPVSKLMGQLILMYLKNISCPNRYYNFAEYNPMYRGFMVQRDGAPGPFGEKGTDAVVG